MQNYSSKISVIALVATADRNKLLFSRSIPSIYAQTRRPDRIVIVNDNEANDIEERLKKEFPQKKIPIDYINNRRTAGASGAWNSGIDHIARHYENYESTFVAILDDDDSWNEDYIANAVFAMENGAEVMATKFLRLEERRTPTEISPPETLQEQDFFVKNPGIQGSNLIVRLDVMLKAGMFDEALRSTTDRDLCIRLSQLRPHYRRIDKQGMLHYACSQRGRLSSPESSAKQQGLDFFFRKYAPLMADAEKRAFKKCAADRFGWKPNNMKAICKDSLAPKITDEEKNCNKFSHSHLAIGFIADDKREHEIKNLLNDIERLQHEHDIIGLDVVIVRNGKHFDFDCRLEKLVNGFRCRHLRIHLFKMADIKQACKAQEVIIESKSGKLSIAEARTILQTYMYHFIERRPGCVAWILDDDMRLNPLVESETEIKRQYIPIAGQLKKMREQKIDIAIGQYTGAAPLPTMTTVRCQMVDLLFALKKLSRLPKDRSLPAVDAHNRYLRHNRNDYYYDLTRLETDRLETPFELVPESDAETAENALLRLSKIAVRILAGEQIFRPLVQNENILNDFIIGDAQNRGGNSFIFDVEAFRDMPNLSAKINGRFTRRSDMIWAYFQKQKFNRKVKSVPTATYQDRSQHPVLCDIDTAKIIDDIYGYALYRALSESEAKKMKFAKLFKKYTEERFSALRLSFYRIIGIAQGLEQWAKHEASPHALPNEWLKFAEKLRGLFKIEILHEIEGGLHSYEKHELSQIRKDLPNEIKSHQARIAKGEPMSSTIKKQIEAQRFINAEVFLKTSYPNIGSLKRLGCGYEGTVLTDGHKVFKIFDYCKSQDFDYRKKLMNSLVKNWHNTKSLYPILDYQILGVSELLAYPYEESENYAGGYGYGMTNLMAECLKHNIVCRNISQGNLRLTGEMVRLIDYGGDILRIGDPSDSLKLRADNVEFQTMCRRAFLVWKSVRHKGSKKPMPKINSSSSQPELKGFEDFFKAVCFMAGIIEFEDPVINLARERSKHKPARSLDYGCGKGKQAQLLSALGGEVTLYDPDKKLLPRLESLQNGSLKVAYSKDDLTASEPFDLIICRRVACIVDDNDLLHILKTLRSLVSENGRVIFGFCHPLYNHRCATKDAVPLECHEQNPKKTFIWHKACRSTGRVLKEYHRPLHRYRHLFKKAGFKIISTREREAIDFHGFQTISDLIAFELC